MEITKGNYFKLIGNNIIPIKSTYELGSTAEKIAKLWLENIAIGGVVDGDLDMDGNDILGVGKQTSPFSNEGNLGATKTFDFTSKTNYRGVPTEAITITVSGLADGQYGSLTLHSDETARAITWAGIDYWQGGYAPALGPATNEALVVALFNDGSKIIASGEIFK